MLEIAGHDEIAAAAREFDESMRVLQELVEVALSRSIVLPAADSPLDDRLRAELGAFRAALADWVRDARDRALVIAVAATRVSARIAEADRDSAAAVRDASR